MAMIRPSFPSLDEGKAKRRRMHSTLVGAPQMKIPAILPSVSFESDDEARPSTRHVTLKPRKTLTFPTLEDCQSPRHVVLADSEYTRLKMRIDSQPSMPQEVQIRRPVPRWFYSDEPAMAYSDDSDRVLQTPCSTASSLSSFASPPPFLRKCEANAEVEFAEEEAIPRELLLPLF